MAGYMYLGNKKVCPAIVLGGGDSDIIPQTVDSGVYKGIAINEFKLPDDAVTIDSNTTDVLNSAFLWDTGNIRGPSWLTSINLNNLKSVYGRNSFAYMCYGNRQIVSFSASSLEEVDGMNVFFNSCRKCINLTEIDFSSLKKVKGSSPFRTFCAECDNLEYVEFNGLEEIGEDNDEYTDSSTVFSGSFYKCPKLKTVKFQKLKYIYPYSCFYQCFYDCRSLTDIYFYSLLPNFFGSVDKDQFAGMFGGSTNGVKVHFPSNLSSSVQELEGYPNFGGTNTTILYDLPATEN